MKNAEEDSTLSDLRGVSKPKVESLLLLRYTYALSGWDNTRLTLKLSGSSNDLLYP